jgi:hypothetical protein
MAIELKKIQALGFFGLSYSKIEVLKWNIIYYMVKNEDHGELSKMLIYKFTFLIKKIIICVKKPR